LNAYKTGLDKLEEPWEMVQTEDVPQHIGTSFYRQALYTPGVNATLRWGQWRAGLER